MITKKDYVGYKKLAKKYGIDESKISCWVRQDIFKTRLKHNGEEKRTFPLKFDYDSFFEKVKQSNEELIYIIEHINKEEIEDVNIDEIQDADLIRRTMFYKYAKSVFRTSYLFAKSTGCNIEDCIQDGFAGLLTAIERYIENPEISFENYYGVVVYSEHQRKYEKENCPFQISHNQKRFLMMFLPEYGKLIQKVGIEKFLDYIPDEVYNNLKNNYPYIFSYLSDIPEEVSEEIDSGISVEKDVIYMDFLEKIYRALSILPPREQECLKFHFGLDGYQQKSLAGIGRYFNVTPERVRQIEARALRRLRNPKISSCLRSFMELF